MGSRMLKQDGGNFARPGVGLRIRSEMITAGLGMGDEYELVIRACPRFCEA